MIYSILFKICIFLAVLSGIVSLGLITYPGNVEELPKIYKWFRYSMCVLTLFGILAIIFGSL